MIDWLISQVAAIWSAFTSWASSIYATVRGWFSTAYQYIATTASNIYSTVRGWFSAVYDYVSTQVTNAYNTIRTWFNSVYDYVTTTASNIYSTLRGWFNDAYACILTTASNILATARDWISSIYDTITTTASSIYSTIKTWFSDVYDWALGIFAQIRNLWATILPGLEDWWATKAEGVRLAINSAFAQWDDLFNWWSKVKTTVINFFTDLPAQIQERLPWTWLHDLLVILIGNITETEEQMAIREKDIPEVDKAIDNVLKEMFPIEQTPPGVTKEIIDKGLATLTDKIRGLG